MNIRQPILLRSMLAAAGVLLAILALGATRAGANTYCVDVPGPTGCTTNQSNFQTALDAADSNPGPDVVKLGPVTVVTPNNDGFSYTATQTAAGGNSVDIVGAGPGQTVLKLAAADVNKSFWVMNLQAFAGSRIRDLSIDVSNNDGENPDLGLVLDDNNSATNISVFGTGSSNATGVRCQGCSFSDSTVNIPNGTPNQNLGFSGYAGDSQITNSTISSDVAVNQNDPNGTAFIKNSRLSAYQGVTSDGGEFDIQDSLIKVDSTDPNATGVYLDNGNNQMGPAILTIDAVLDGVTIVSTGSNNSSTGIRAAARKTNEATNVVMKNSLITGTEYSLKLLADHKDLTNEVTVSTSHSAYEQDRVQQDDNSGAGMITFTTDASDVDLPGEPVFFDVAGGNYTPVAGSALIDAGDPAPLGVGATDILGNPRACNGTPGGSKIRDIGAFEYNDCVDPNTSITGGPGPVTEVTAPGFTLASSKPSSTFLCSFDGGPDTACTTPLTAPDLGLGNHQLRVTAVDVYGNTDKTPATYDYTVVQTVGPTCETDPSLCPPADRTPPVVKLTKKVPRTTKKKAVRVSFKSNEAGSTFTCRVGKAKAKKCKSPFNAKLKKGKNVVSIVATDKAGNLSKPKKVKITRK